MAYSAEAQTLKQYKAFPDYSSASAMEWHRGRLYVMGDDAPTLLVLNRRLKKRKEIRLFDAAQKRIPYAVKPDIESAAIVRNGKKDVLWLLPSLSTASRNKAVVLDLKHQQPEIRTLRLGNPGITAINIEGAAIIKEQLLLANRANSGPASHFLLLYALQNNNLAQKPERIFALTLPPTAMEVGISGLHYVASKDVLLVTVSTELSSSATTDGTIGDSYLAIVPNCTQQLKTGDTLTAALLINLTPILQTSKPMKIESVTARRATGRRLRLFLAADNDDGTSHLFRISVKLAR